MRIGRLRQLEQEQQRQIDLSVTVEAFCRNISTALDNPSFETKQKILRLVVERIDFVNDQITIRHVIPVSAGPPADRQLRRNCLHKISDTLGPRSRAHFDLLLRRAQRIARSGRDLLSPDGRSDLRGLSNPSLFEFRQFQSKPSVSKLDAANRRSNRPAEGLPTSWKTGPEMIVGLKAVA